MTNPIEELTRVITHHAQAFGGHAANSATAAAEYAEQRAEHLAGIHGEPGFEEAVEAEAQNVAIQMGLELTDTATSAEAGMLGVLNGALSVAAGWLASIAGGSSDGSATGGSAASQVHGSAGP